MKRLNRTMLMANGKSAAPGKIAPFWASVRLNAWPQPVISRARTMKANEVANIDTKHARNSRPRWLCAVGSPAPYPGALWVMSVIRLSLLFRLSDGDGIYAAGHDD